MDPRHNHISDLILKQLHHSAELAAKKHVQEFPLDGQGWLLLGESLMKQGKGRTAQLLFNRALFLDPKGQWMPFMREELQKVPCNEIVSKEIQLLLSTPKVTVSAALIVKDEERSIERCIQSILNAVDEVIVIDSGSTDQTLSILQKYPQVQVYHVQWNDNFAELRNEALSHVRSEWVFWLDADEWLHEEDQELIRLAAGIYSSMKTYVPALQPAIMNYVGNKCLSEYSVPRLFQTNKGIHFSGRIHEQIATEKEGIFTSNIIHKPVGIRLHHDGYEPEIKSKKNKIARNIELLRKMTKEEPSNPGWWYFLGRETMNTNDKQASLFYFTKAIELGQMNSHFGRIAEIHVLMGKIYTTQDNLEAAEKCYSQALSIHPDYPDAHFLLANITVSKAQKLLEGAYSHVNKATTGFHSYRGTIAPDQDIYLWRSELLRSDILVLNGHFGEAVTILQALKEKFPNLEVVERKLTFINEQVQLVSNKS
ncbi:MULTISPECIES: glycosyltransferase [Paenibacillus]|uniref:glycosyltransferase n=1 Tax=Paenibacillus TaxID=44249 RepID=UPI00280BF26F|nr:glycosyltransferase [Paenibacillus polysaccharolyticus]